MTPAHISCLLAVATLLLQQEDYQPYRGHDVADVATLNTTPEGKHTATLDLRKLQVIVDDLATHAQNYPPRFAAPEERELAERDARKLSELFATMAIVKAERSGAEALLLAGRLEAMAHNLDIKGAAGRASACFGRLLQLDPDHVQGNLHFGTFLAGTATRQKEALPHLEKALRLGEERARYPLGLAQVMLGNRAAALEHLRAYAAKHPTDERVKKLIAAVESGAIERVESGPAAASRAAAGAASRPGSSRPATRGR